MPVRTSEVQEFTDSQPRPPAPCCFCFPLPQTIKPHISHRTQFSRNTAQGNRANLVPQSLKHRKNAPSRASHPPPQTSRPRLPHCRPVTQYHPSHRPVYPRPREPPAVGPSAPPIQKPQAREYRLDSISRRPYKPCRRLSMRSNPNPPQCTARRYGPSSATMACTKALGISEMRRTRCARVNFSSNPRPTYPASTTVANHDMKDTTSLRPKKKTCSSTRR